MTTKKSNQKVYVTNGLLYAHSIDLDHDWHKARFGQRDAIRTVYFPTGFPDGIGVIVIGRQTAEVRLACANEWEVSNITGDRWKEAILKISRKPYVRKAKKNGPAKRLRV